MNISDVQSQLREFAQARDWEQFHSPKNLAMALTGEVGELNEIFQWLTPEQSVAVMADERSAERVRHELADVLAYALRLADVLGVDLDTAIREKLALNGQRYPADLAKGNAIKYTDLGGTT